MTKARWDDFASYLHNLQFEIGQRIILTIDDIRRIVGVQVTDLDSLNYPTQWDWHMSKKGSIPYKNIADAEFDIIRIEFGLDPARKHNIVKFIEIEKVGYNTLQDLDRKTGN